MYHHDTSLSEVTPVVWQRDAASSDEGEQSTGVKNRKAFLLAVIAGKSQAAVTITPAVTRILSFGANFDEVDDRSIFDFDAGHAGSNKIASAKYSRPVTKESPNTVSVVKMMSIIASIFEHGIHLASATESLGFTFLYEIMTGPKP